MKQLTLITLVILTLASCAQTDEDKAEEMLQRINALYEEGNYRAALDSITVLRENYPTAIEARKAALVVWQNASLKMAQDDVAKTDVLLQQTIAELNTTTDRYRRNMLGVKRDSLQARYEAMCGVVRMIHIRQKNQSNEHSNNSK